MDGNIRNKRKNGRCFNYDMKVSFKNDNYRGGALKRMYPNCHQRGGKVNSCINEVVWKRMNWRTWKVFASTTNPIVNYMEDWIIHSRHSNHMACDDKY